jgi:PmbA protein
VIERIRDRLSGRARWFDIIEIRGTSTPVSFKNNRLHSITEHNNSGYGVRVNVDGRTGFSYTNDGARLIEAADRALELSSWGDTEDFDLPAKAAMTFQPYDASINDFDVKLEIAQAEDTIAALLRAFPKATIDMHISKSDGDARIINSNGIDISYRSSRYSASISATLILDDGTRIDTGESASSLAPAPYGQLRDKIIRKIKAALVTKPLSSGTIPVILSPRAFARIIGIMNAGLSAKSVWKGVSPFADKKGVAMFNKSLTVRDDPEIIDSPYSYPFDDEGVMARNKFLVNRGKIETFITDLKHAQKLNLLPEGNGARGYSSLPYPSFSSIIIEPGTDSQDAIIRSISRGILVEQFIGLGQSNTLSGDFSANLDLAYLVENGTITGRVKDCMLSDNLFRLLAGEIILSGERERIGSVLAPYVLFPAVSFTG